MSKNYENEEVPMEVESFVRKLSNALKANSNYELNGVYNEFTELSLNMFRSSRWPAPELLEAKLKKSSSDGKKSSTSDAILFYTEMYYRHAFQQRLPKSTNGPSFKEQDKSFKNFVALFNKFLLPSDLNLPMQWLWDIMNESLYQFRRFHQHRLRLADHSEEDIAVLKAEPYCWHPQTMMNYLTALAKSGGYTPAHYGTPLDTSKVSEFHRSLGYFAIVSLCEIHTLLCDYATAVEVTAPIIGERGPAAMVMNARITLAANLGFSNLMLRNYNVACRLLSHIVLDNRSLHLNAEKYRDMMLMHRLKQVHATLALAAALAPNYHDDYVLNILRDGGLQDLVNNRSSAALAQLFARAAPRFVDPCVPNYAATPKTNHDEDLANLQRSLLIGQAQSTLKSQRVVKFLRMCQSVTLEKLGQFLRGRVKSEDKSEPALSEEEVATLLLAAKRQCMRNPKKQNEGRGRDSSLNFYVAGDTVNVSLAQSRQQHGHIFTHQILDLEDILHKLSY